MKPDRTSWTARLYHLRASGSPVCQHQSKTSRVVVRRGLHEDRRHGCGYTIDKVLADVKKFERSESLRNLERHCHRAAAALENARLPSILIRSDFARWPQTSSRSSSQGVVQVKTL